MHPVISHTALIGSTPDLRKVEWDAVHLVGNEYKVIRAYIDGVDVFTLSTTARYFIFKELQNTVRDARGIELKFQ